MTTRKGDITIERNVPFMEGDEFKCMTPSEFERQYGQRFDADAMFAQAREWDEAMRQLYGPSIATENFVEHTGATPSSGMTEQEFTAMLDEVEYMTGWRPDTVRTYRGVFPIYTRRRTRGKQPRWVRVRIAASRLSEGL